MSQSSPDAPNEVGGGGGGGWSRADWWPGNCMPSPAPSCSQMPASARWHWGSVGAMSSPWGPGLPFWTGTPRWSPPSLSSSRINPTTDSMMGKSIQRGGILLVSSWQKFPPKQRGTNYSVVCIVCFILHSRFLWVPSKIHHRERELSCECSVEEDKGPCILWPRWGQRLLTRALHQEGSSSAWWVVFSKSQSPWEVKSCWRAHACGKVSGGVEEDAAPKAEDELRLVPFSYSQSASQPEISPSEPLGSRHWERSSAFWVQEGLVPPVAIQPGSLCAFSPQYKCWAKSSNSCSKWRVTLGNENGICFTTQSFLLIQNLPKIRKYVWLMVMLEGWGVTRVKGKNKREKPALHTCS